MHRFFTEDIRDSLAFITGEDVHHLKRVLRLRPGDAVSICDGHNTDYDGVIRSLGENEASVELTNPRPSPYEPGLSVTLYQGLPKAGKLDFVVQKCVELGVARIVPLLTKRCVSEPVRDFEKKRTRLQRIADEAAKQSRRGLLPEVTGIESLESLDGSAYDLVLVAYEEERGRSIKDVLRGREIHSAAIVVGPEGGLAQEEVALLKSRGAIPVSLGKSILRTETAGLKAVSNLIYEVCE